MYAVAAIFFVTIWTASPILASDYPEKGFTKLPDPPNAPDLHIDDITGKLRTIDDFKGKPFVVHFWADLKTLLCESEEGSSHARLHDARWAQHQCGITADNRS